MSIRRKLFFAFVAAAALPLLAMGVLARLYLQRARVDVEQRFVQHAREAVKAVSDRACDRDQILKAALKRLAHHYFLHEPGDEGAHELHVYPPGWLESNEGKAYQAKLDKAKAMARKITVEVKDKGVHVAALVDWDDDDLEAAVKRFREAHPQVIGVQVVVDNQVVFCDFKPDIGSSIEMTVDPPMAMADGEEREMTFAWEDGRRFLVWGRDADVATRIRIEVDPRSMLEPMAVAGVRAFYLASDGQARHTPQVRGQLEKELPLTALAHEIPSGGETAVVEAGGEPWRIYTATSAERDTHNYGGDARLVAVAPEDQVLGPLTRFRAEVVAAGLLSLLVAVGLSYFLSGRFSESVENLKRGVDALSRGEFAHLEKSSGDELGGELVESMNRMASALAERTRKEEIEGWRRLVRVLSHEINNTLGPVKSVASTVRDQLAPKLEGETGDDLKSAFKLIVDRVDSLSSFISGYAVLAKLPPPDRAPADFNEVVRGAVSMLKEQRSIVEDYDDEVGTPLIDKQQMERVVINLVKNAVEAATSSVYVMTRRRGDTVELAVEDNGPGIAPDARAHLFVPYYTTKPGGSGIGLALARQIVLGHGGTIGTRDREGGGTIVFVIFPCA